MADLFNHFGPVLRLSLDEAVRWDDTHVCNRCGCHLDDHYYRYGRLLGPFCKNCLSIDGEKDPCKPLSEDEFNVMLAKLKYNLSKHDITLEYEFYSNRYNNR